MKTVTANFCVLYIPHPLHFTACIYFRHK